jgi:hypothetical protein
MPKYGTAQSTKVRTLWWEMTTPFGSPVDPDVKNS